MKTTDYPGINYATGTTSNLDIKTGIRFGVISQHSVLPEAINEMEAFYGPPTCPLCGKQADEPSAFGETFANGVPDDYTSNPHECDDYVCVDCKKFFGSESAFGDEPLCHYIDSATETIKLDTGGDVWVIKSPYFTHAQFCSPCAPGACYLTNPLSTPLDSNKCYCLGADWFEDSKAPYPIYSVATGQPVP
jgi:hypothetical protein